MSKTERMQRKISELQDLYFEAQDAGDEARCKKLYMEILTLRETYEIELMQPASMGVIDYGYDAVCRAMAQHQNPCIVDPILN